MALATLSIDLVAQLAQLQQGLDKAGHLAARTASQIEAKFAGLSRIAGTFGVTLGGALAGAGLTSLIRSTVEGIDKLNDLSDATGASVEKLSALEDAARRTGTGVDVVGDALIKLNKTLVDAKPGSDQEAALRGIGLSAAELKRLDPADALLKTAQALAGFADDGNKARLTQELFGKSLRDVAPLLKDLVEKGQLNATVTKEQAEEAEKFRKQSFELEKNLTDLARTITSAVVPALNAMFERVKAEGFFSLFREGDAQKQIAEADDLARSIKVVGDALERADAISKRADLPGSARSSWAERARALRAQLEGLQSQALKVTDAMKGAVSGSGKSPRDLLRGIEAASATRPSAPDGLDLGKKAKPRESDVNDVLGLDAATLAAIKRLQDTNAAKIAQLRIELQALLELGGEEAQGGPEAIKRLNEEIFDLTNQKMPPPEPVQAYQDALAALADTDIVRIQRLNAALEELGKMRGLDLAGPEVEEAIKRLRKQLEELQHPLEQVSEFAREASRNIQDALGDTILASMERNARSIEEIWKDMIKRMLAQAAAARLNEALFGKGFGTTTSSLGGWFGWLWGAVSGGGGGQSSQPSTTGAAGRASVGGAAGVVMNVSVQGDATKNTLRAMRAVVAEAMARQQRAQAMGG